MTVRWRALLVALFTLAGTTAGAAAESNPVARQPAAAAEPAVRRLLVKLQDTGASGPSALASRGRFRLVESHHLASGLHAMQVQPENSGETLATTLARLRADPSVQFAEVDERRYAHAAPNDPLFTGQWYLQSAATNLSAVDAVSAWNTTTGSVGLVIAELDTGVRFDHPDLLRGGSSGKLLPGYDFISDVATANDGDGRDADASDPGDWVNSTDTGTSQFRGCTTGGSSWHGTRVAGILGALSNNSAGVAGLNWNGWILPVRVLGKCGGYDSDIIAAMLWAAGQHVTGVPDNLFPAKIINMSLGAARTCSSSYQLTINQLAALGVLVVVSAGNEGGPVDSPGNCTGVAAVAGLRHVGTKVGFSSLGPQVTVSAPAGNCVNTGAGQPCLFSIDTTYNTGSTTPGNNGYTDQINPNLGTSFSAPIVAGVAGLMTAVNGNLSTTQLIARLREGANPFPSTSPTTPAPPVCHVPTGSTDLQQSECICTVQTCGAGMANASGAVAAALRPIAAVSVPASVSPGQNVVLQGIGSAAACGRSVVAYAWSIVSPGSAPPGISGANTSTATVVAPATGSFTVRLTVTDDTGRTDSADTVVTATAATTAAPASAGSNACLPGITLTAAGNVTVAVAPSTANVIARSNQTFSATVSNTGILPVTWQVNGVTGGNASVGTITTSGVYTAPASAPTPATVTVTAISTALSTATASAQVTVSTAYPVTVSPVSATLIAGGSGQTFSATVAGAASGAVNWQVNGITGGNASVGVISTTGVYSPPTTVPANGTVTITAVAQADTSSSAAAQIPIMAPAVTVTAGGNGGSGGGGALDGLSLLTLLLLFGYACAPDARSQPGRRTTKNR